jgi:hypothetical protein
MESPSASSAKEEVFNAEMPPGMKQRGNTFPSTDAEIETAGSSFLDAVEMSLGLG